MKFHWLLLSNVIASMNFYHYYFNYAILDEMHQMQ